MFVCVKYISATQGFKEHYLFLAADQSRIMQEQMTGAAMAMPPDPNKAFKVSVISYHKNCR